MNSFRQPSASRGYPGVGSRALSIVQIRPILALARPHCSNDAICKVERDHVQLQASRMSLYTTTYSWVGSLELKVDILVPPSIKEGILGGVVFFHGGGMTAGHRCEYLPWMPGSFRSPLCSCTTLIVVPARVCPRERPRLPLRRLQAHASFHRPRHHLRRPRALRLPIFLLFLQHAPPTRRGA